MSLYRHFRDKAQVEKKAMVNKLEEDENDRRKEIGLIKNQLQKVAYITFCVSINLRNLVSKFAYYALVDYFTILYSRREKN